MDLSLAVQESHRSPCAVPVVRKAPRETCGLFCVNVNGYFQFCSILCKEPSDQCTCLFSFRILAFTLHFISLAFLCQLFVFCRSQCEQGPITIYSVMLLNRSCLFLLSLYKILQFCCFSSVEASSP